jgi:hypothetical protein
LHVPGVHVIAIAVALAVPEHVCGPLSEIFPSAVTEPVKPSNGGANERAHCFSVTTAAFPTSDASQCAVTFQLPETSGQVAPPLDEADDDDAAGELELLHAARTRRTRARIGSSYAKCTSPGPCA